MTTALARRIATGAIALAGSLALVACGSDDAEEKPAATTTANDSASSSAVNNDDDDADDRDDDADDADDRDDQDDGTMKAGATSVSREDALAAALKHAGVDAAAATEQEAELDNDQDDDDQLPPHWEIQFKANGTEYDYDIDANTGEILRSESEPDD
ncbi:PepSY domain-containing protein [Corynebacterium sp.]|uniref:PepSY domain-containing protein n=1 Tax=Corynebacterium sp. TaxID=1720 RepID=UPI0026DD9E06|nr:PepSY domain-containing protein [Corynebacterium sp.]MDO5033064.1 PepSY domain-containing protein [Corynebacterium sp.]